MAYAWLLTGRNLAMFSAFSLGSGFMMMKSKALAERNKKRAAGDYSVSVDRSGGGI